VAEVTEGEADTAATREGACYLHKRQQDSRLAGLRQLKEKRLMPVSPAKHSRPCRSVEKVVIAMCRNRLIPFRLAGRIKDS
jgi:hypothetical protein